MLQLHTDVYLSLLYDAETKGNGVRSITYMGSIYANAWYNHYLVIIFRTRV